MNDINNSFSSKRSRKIDECFSSHSVHRAHAIKKLNLHHSLDKT